MALKPDQAICRAITRFWCAVRSFAASNELSVDWRLVIPIAPAMATTIKSMYRPMGIRSAVKRTNERRVRPCSQLRISAIGYRTTIVPTWADWRLNNSL